MDSITPLAKAPERDRSPRWLRRLAVLFTGLLVLSGGVQADQTIFQPMIFSTGSSLTIQSGITATFASGSTVNFTGATVSGLSYEPALGNPSTSGFILSSTTGGTRSWIAPPAGSSTLPLTTVVATVAQTATAPTAHMTYTVGAGSVQVGTVYHLHAYGDANNGTTAITFTPNIWWGGTGGVLLLNPSFASSTAAANFRAWILDANVIFRNVGVSGTSNGDVTLIETSNDATGLRTTRIQASAIASVDTSVAKDLVFGWTLSATTGTPQVRTLGGYIQLVK